MSEEYSVDNVFYKIINGTIPAKKVIETDLSLSFYDVNPKTKIHVLVIPKGKYIDAYNFYKNASNEEIKDFAECIAATIEKLDLKGGYRLISNSGLNGGQEVPHFHIHILGGEKLGRMV